MDVKSVILDAFKNTKSPVAYSSPLRIYKYLKYHDVKVTLKKVKQVLQENVRSYGILKQKNKTFLHQRIVSDGFDFVWQADWKCLKTKFVYSIIRELVIYLPVMLSML